MNTLLNLVRPEIRALRPYQAARFEAGLIRLNANETPWRPPGDTTLPGLNHYPEPRPTELTQRLAKHYGLDAERVLVTRGSSEAIDLLIRCFCRPGIDEVIICPPTFGMYQVYARIQGAGVSEVPLLKEKAFDLDVAGIEQIVSDVTKLVFICSPNNPTGNQIPVERLAEVARSLQGHGLLVLDAAYGEFAGHDPSIALLDRFENIVVLRTLSKAAGLAGIRCGAALGAAAVIEMLNRILAPFCYPTPSETAALASLDENFQTELQLRIDTIRSERDRLADELQTLDNVVKIWPSEANFLLVQARDPDRMVKAAQEAGILLRDFSWEPQLDNAVRITVGDARQNDLLISALR
jgi:histidinol-phosphate aminotransferase